MSMSSVSVSASDSSCVETAGRLDTQRCRGVGELQEKRCKVVAMRSPRPCPDYLIDKKWRTLLEAS